MKKVIIIIFALCIIGTNIQAEEIYSQTFGDNKNPAVVFLHGGPGYNSANFERSAAETLAAKGFFVIVYDRRGEGRSSSKNAAFTFEQSFEDIDFLFKKYDINKSSFIGHSFGGILACKYAEKYPEKVRLIYLVGAPVSLQKSFKTIIKKCKAIYEKKGDSGNLKYITMLENMDTTSMQYASYCFMHAMQNGFYTPEVLNNEAKQLYSQLAKDSVFNKHASQMTYDAPKGFSENEAYTTIDLTPIIKDLSDKNAIRIVGLYGKDDGLYSEKQIDELRELIGRENVLYFDNCSHNVFMDRKNEFIDSLVKFEK